MGMNDVPRCQHVKVNGTQCGSPALRRSRFCYFHDNYREIRTRLLDEDSPPCVSNFPLLEDANSVQLAVMQVIHMLGSGRVDTKVAGLMLYALQTATANLKRVNFEAAKPTDVVIDQETLALTCINGPQWFERDFKAPEEKPQSSTTAKREEVPAEPAKLRKKPDLLKDSPDMDNSLAGLLLKHLGIVPVADDAGYEESVPTPDPPEKTQY